MTQFRKGYKKLLFRPIVRLPKKRPVAQALAMAKSNKREIRRLKQYHVSPALSSTAIVNATAFAAAPTITHLPVTGEGFDVLVKSLRLRGVIKANYTSALVDSWRVDV